VLFYFSVLNLGRARVAKKLYECSQCVRPPTVPVPFEGMKRLILEKIPVNLWNCEFLHFSPIYPKTHGNAH
jgi:hypothetical protein